MTEHSECGGQLIVSSSENSTPGNGNHQKSRVCTFFASFVPHEKPLRISITVIHLVLNVEFQIDMLPRLRKTGLRRHHASKGRFTDYSFRV